MSKRHEARKRQEANKPQEASQRQAAAKPQESGKHQELSKRQELREKRRRQEQTRRLLTLAGIAVFVIAIAMVLIIPNLPQPVGTVIVPDPVDRPQANFNSLGDPNAPVKIVEYSDYQCPFCAQFWKNTEKQLVETYVKNGTVYYTSRSMGNFISDNLNRSLNGTNRESEQASQAAYCAGDQNKYWDYHDMLYANQGKENSGAYNRSRLDAFAEKLSLDLNAFKSCMDTRKYADRVTQDGVDGLKDITTNPAYDGSGVGTPSFLINGKLLTGAQPLSAFKTEIDAILAKK